MKFVLFLVVFLFYTTEANTIIDKIDSLLGETVSQAETDTVMVNKSQKRLKRNKDKSDDIYGDLSSDITSEIKDLLKPDEGEKDVGDKMKEVLKEFKSTNTEKKRTTSEDVVKNKIIKQEISQLAANLKQNINKIENRQVIDNQKPYIFNPFSLQPSDINRLGTNINSNSVLPLNPNNSYRFQQNFENKDPKYLKLAKHLKMKNTRELFTNSQIDNSDVIFPHVFVANNGISDVPGVITNPLFNSFTNEFVLPYEVIKEDDITKLMRIESILKSINFNTDNKQDNEEEKGNEKLLTQQTIQNILNPPILKGMELYIKTSSGNEANSLASHSDKLNKFLGINGEKGNKKEITKIISNSKDNNFLKIESKIDASSYKIIQPPNFLY